MKKITLFCLSLAISGILNTAHAQYCTVAYATTPCATSIIEVSTANGTTNFTNATTCGNNGYTDYTTNTGILVAQDAGKTVNVTVRIPSSTMPDYSGKVNIYVDWNQNQVFEPNATIPELMVPQAGHYLVNSANSSQLSITIPVYVPEEAKDGLTRMRVQLASQGSVFTTPLGPCGTQGAFGETEDYNFDVNNPCLPPNVISITDITDKSVKIAWTEKKNAVLYEYLVKQDPTVPPMGQVGFNFTTDEMVDLNNLSCGEKYYVFLRCICDSSGSAQNWDISDWKIDSFTVHECCYNPNVMIENVTSTTMQFSWAPVPTSHKYEYAVTTSPIPPQSGSFTTSTRILQQGLQPKTTYFVHVRSFCSPTPFSSWESKADKTLKALSVEELAQGAFSITAYPNPVGDVLNVNIEGQIADNAQLQLTDITGKVLYSTNVTTEQVSINTAELPKGIYMVRYADEQQNRTIKISK